MTFGMALVLQGAFQHAFGALGLPSPSPDALTGGVNLDFMLLRRHRGWVQVCSILVRLATWLPIERTRIGSPAARGDREPVAGPGLRRRRAAGDHPSLRRGRRGRASSRIGSTR